MARSALGLLRLALLAAGAAFIAYLVWEIGPAAVWDTIRTLSWRLLLVVAVPYGLTSTVDTLAWRLALPGARPPFGVLWSARLAGEAVNLTTPTASVGGEPVKAYLLRPWVPLTEGLASVVLDKTTIVVGQGLFLLLGLALGLGVVAVPGPLMLGMGLLLGLETAAVAGFVAVQMVGAAGVGGRMLARLGVAGGGTAQARLEGLDRVLATAYRRRRARLAAAALCHALAWGLGSLEIYLVLRLLGLPVSPAGAMVLEAFGTAIKFVTFVIPGSLGALEGGNVAIFSAFGLPPAVGLSYTLVRRVREAAWAAAGLVALGALGRGPEAGRGAG